MLYLPLRERCPEGTVGAGRDPPLVPHMVRIHPRLHARHTRQPRQIALGGSHEVRGHRAAAPGDAEIDCEHAVRASCQPRTSSMSITDIGRPAAT